MLSDNELFHDAISQWGGEFQINQAQEELAELIVALNHVRRSRKNMDVDKLVGEIADAQIMIDQMIYLHQIPIDKIREMRILKMSRLESLLFKAKRRAERESKRS